VLTDQCTNHRLADLLPDAVTHMPAVEAGIDLLKSVEDVRSDRRGLGLLDVVAVCESGVDRILRLGHLEFLSLLADR